MDTHIQRTKTLGNHPFEVGLGKPGQSGEVPVEEREAVFVILDV